MTAKRREFNDLSRMQYAREYRIALVRETGIKIKLPVIRSPLEAAGASRACIYEDLDRELFGILMLNTRNKVIGYNVISIGSLGGSLVHSREIFKAAILSNSAAIVCFHNHPSGDPLPSKEDLDLTRRIVKAGEIIGIPILDHIILGDLDPREGESERSSFYSFKSSELIK